MKEIIEILERRIKQHEEDYNMYLERYEKYYNLVDQRKYYEERLNITRGKINELQDVILLIKNKGVDKE